MSDAKRKPGRSGSCRTTHQRGIAAVEFALLAIVFFTIVFGILELARAMYLFNTLQEVTRRAAALAASSAFDQDTIDDIRSRALFRNPAGNLMLGDPITPQHLKIEYLSISSADGVLTTQPASPMPACPATNYINCLTDPYGANCIRLVRVRICEPGGAGDCTAVPYKMMLPFLDLSGARLPISATIVPTQGLGRVPGALPCL